MLRRCILAGITLMLWAATLVAQTSPGLQSSGFGSVGTGLPIHLLGTGIQYHQITWATTGTVSTCQVTLDSSTDGVTWTTGGVVASQLCTSNGASATINVNVNYVRANVSTLSGGGSVTITWLGWQSNPGGGGGGSGTVNAATQYSVPYYSVAGSSTTVSGVAAPTSPSGVPQFYTSTNSGGVAAAPTFTLAGVSGRTVTGTTDTIAVTDRAAWVSYNSASAVAATLPQAGSTGFASNFAFGVKNIGAGAVTITPTTSTIDGNATLVVSQGQNCTITSYDNTNYVSRCASGQITAGTNITITPSANGLSIAAAGGGSGVAFTTSSASASAFSGTTDSPLTVFSSAGNNITVSPVSGTLAALYVRFSTALASTDSFAVTVYKNGAATTSTCTVSSSTQTCDDITHTSTFAAGDTLGFHTVCTGAGSCNAGYLSMGVKMSGVN